MSFGENLISLRKQMGWSQDDLANNLNLSRQAISKWENDTSKPDIDNVKKISKIFSVTIDDLLNNEVPKEKAVALDVKKQEKKERTITIVKLMIIAVIVLYVISVIYKFASLLIIVNGVQKYANLSNYHYVITTYDENGLAEKEECWFKDGVSKTVNTLYEGNDTNTMYTNINYNENYGYMESEESKNRIELDIQDYKFSHIDYENGKQLYNKLPIEIRKNNIFFKALDIKNIDIINNDDSILIKIENNYILINNNNLLPIVSYTYDEKHNEIKNYSYQIDVNSVDDIII